MKSRIGNRLGRAIAGPWILTILLVLLALCWWSMPFNLFPGSFVAVPDYIDNPDEFRTMLEKSPLYLRLGFWIDSIGWDAGPPDEYVFDFILFWHLALSCLAYLVIFCRWLREVRHQETEDIPLAFTESGLGWILFLYPILSVIIISIFPWNDDIIIAHKYLCFFIYPPFFWSLNILMRTCRLVMLKSILLWTSCVTVAVFAFNGPILGGALDILIIFGIAIIMLIMAIAVLIMDIKKHQVVIE